MDVAGETSLTDVLAVLGALSAAGCRAWVGGGWGVDVLAGRVTRSHRDLDLAVDARDEATALETLAGLGYAIETDWRPVRVELVAAGRGRVDLHPVRFDAHGDGVQANLDGHPPFHYPAACFTAGRIGGRTVPCLSASQQLAFHRGYVPREQDLHDLAVLRGLARGTAADGAPVPRGRSAHVLGLTRRWRSYWPAADVHAAADDVLTRADDAIAAWGLRDARVLHGGNVALVCAARRHGRLVVVKVHPRGHPGEAELRSEAEALAFWQDTGAVPRLLDRRDAGLTLLMEAVTPGTALDDARVPFATRLTVLGGLAARLHGAGAPPGGALHLGTWAAGWRRALADDAGALGELDRLLAPAHSDVLIHADLHGGNALRAGDGWKAIDPHAARADRHADVWALLDPLVPALPGDPAGAARTARAWVARYADAAGMDPGRAAVWTRVRARATALEIGAQAVPAAEDRRWAARLERMAAALT